MLSRWAKKRAVRMAAQTAVDTRTRPAGADIRPHSTESLATAATTMRRKGQAA